MLVLNRVEAFLNEAGISMGGLANGHPHSFHIRVKGLIKNHPKGACIFLEKDYIWT